MSRPLSDLATADVPLGRLTTYRLGGPARWYAEPPDRAALVELLDAWRGTDLGLLVLGRGSNLVVADDGYPGLVVRLGPGFDTIDIDGEEVRAGGGAKLPQLAREAAGAGVGGLEFLVGIPGSVGGAVRQNAGGHGREVVDVIVDAEVLDATTGGLAIWDVLALGLGYRRSRLARTDVVVSARFRGSRVEPAQSESRLRELTRWRREHQPAAVYNAGSVFRNPDGDSAGRIIDSLGLKGYAVGDVAVSEKHANFFIAGPDGTAADLYRLVTDVRRIVAERTGVDLQPEIQFEGFD